MGPEMVIWIVGLCTAGWVINNWIRAKHGYALEDEWGGKTTKELPEAERKIGLLTSENEQLGGKSQPLGRTDRRPRAHRD
jgi:hypothetical protein